MAMTIEEFLVQLGFKVNGEELKKFTTSIDGAGRVMSFFGGSMLKLAGIMGLSAGAMELAIGKIAGRYEHLYYVSQRTGATVANLKSFQYAAMQVGMTSEEATQSIEGFAEALRSNPGLRAFASQLGANPEDDPVKQFETLLDKWRNMPFFVAKQQASLFGISPGQLQNYIQNFDLLIKSGKDYEELLKRVGMNADEASKQSVEYERQVRKLEASWSLLAQTWALKALPLAQSIVDFLLRSTGKSQPGRYTEGGIFIPEGGGGVAQGKGEGQAAYAERFLRSMGWGDRAAGMAQRLMVESGMNPNAVGDHGAAYGIAQWHPDRQRAFKAIFGKDIRDSSLQEQLSFVNYELTRGNEQKAGHAIFDAGPDRSYDLFTRLYERPADPTRGSGVTLNQKTDIHVSGGGGAKETADLVVSAQDRVNSDAIRSVVGAVR